MENEEIVVKTAGFSINEKLAVNVGPRICGNIGDGVLFRHDDEGGWLLDYADLERIYLAAKKARE